MPAHPRGDIPHLQINGSKEATRFVVRVTAATASLGQLTDNPDIHYPVTRENHDYGVLDY